MKKFISALLVAICCMAMAMPAQAQVKFGVKGGLNFASLDFKNAGLDITQNSTGFFIGPMVEATVPLIGIGVDGAVLYSQRGKEDFKMQGLEVPINLKYTIGLGNTAGIFIAVGPDFFFNFKDVDIANIEKNTAQVGLNVGAGVKLLNHLQIGVNYQFALGNSFDVKGLDVKSKTNMWQVSLAYMF